MSKGIITAERVSCDASDNFVFQRSILAYYNASELIFGDVLEIGTGSGYGVEVIAPHANKFTTIDKHPTQGLSLPDNCTFRQATVPPLPFDDESFDFVISFQVIEHIKRDKEFVKEVFRVLRPGGKFIVSTPNKKMSLTRNPWHVREYTADEFLLLLSDDFSSVKAMGVEGDSHVMEYYEKNREGVKRITRFDIFNLQYILPRWLLQIPYDILNRLNRRRLLKHNDNLTRSIKMDNYKIVAVHDNCFDLYYVATK